MELKVLTITGVKCTEFLYKSRCWSCKVMIHYNISARNGYISFCAYVSYKEYYVCVSTEYRLVLTDITTHCHLLHIIGLSMTCTLSIYSCN